LIVEPGGSQIVTWEVQEAKKKPNEIEEALRKRISLAETFRQAPRTELAVERDRSVWRPVPEF
jgi:hypothetical protein